MKTPKMNCRHCKKQMIEVFTNEAPYNLEGWSCDCSHTEPAIWRERKFTRDDYGDKTRSGGHMVQQSGEIA
jgi:hypothetical protein